MGGRETKESGEMGVSKKSRRDASRGGRERKSELTSEDSVWKVKIWILRSVVARDRMGASIAIIQGERSEQRGVLKREERKKLELTIGSRESRHSEG